MRTFAISEAEQTFDRVMNIAAQEPVIVQHQKGDMVVLSKQEYERLIQLNVKKFQRFCDTVGTSAAAAGMTEAKLAALLASNE